jgi:nitroreductase
MTGPLIASDVLRKVLDVAPAWKIVAILPVGYPAESPDPPGRKPAASALRWLS